MDLMAFVTNRILFWVTYILGSLGLLLAYLLSQVPRPRHGGDFRADYTCWTITTFLLASSLIAARYGWGEWIPFRRNGRSGLVGLFIGAVWVELAYLLYGIAGFVISR